MFSIIELQTNDNSTAHNFFTAETKDAAMSKFHEVLMYAAIGTVEFHACIVMNEKGEYLARECYMHPKEVEAVELES